MFSLQVHVSRRLDVILGFEKHDPLKKREREIDLIICLYVCEHLCVHRKPWRPTEGVRCLGARVASACWLPDMGPGDLYPCPLKDQEKLITTGPSLQPQTSLLLTACSISENKIGWLFTQTRTIRELLKSENCRKKA